LQELGVEDGVGADTGRVVELLDALLLCHYVLR
jgi:hypothetical protein